VHLSQARETHPLPPESFITVDRLGAVALERAFGDHMPAAAIEWRDATEREVGWM
jgi:hypothetical protein